MEVTASTVGRHVSRPAASPLLLLPPPRPFPSAREMLGRARKYEAFACASRGTAHDKRARDSKELEERHQDSSPDSRTATGEARARARTLLFSSPPAYRRTTR